MPKLALFARLEAKPGKEADVEKFLQAGLGLARQEATTPIWFALRLGPTTFGVFDAFYDEAGRALTQMAEIYPSDHSYRIKAGEAYAERG